MRSRAGSATAAWSRQFHASADWRRLRPRQDDGASMLLSRRISAGQQDTALPLFSAMPRLAALFLAGMKEGPPVAD